jgi:hypothetical protein
MLGSSKKDVSAVPPPSVGKMPLTLDPTKINEMYAIVLDHLLTPPQIKEQLIKSQSIEKKTQTVQMHEQLFENSADGSGGVGGSHSTWGVRENALLSIIQKSKVPDLYSLNRLKIILSSANRECMTSFVESGGVSVLLKIVEVRLGKELFLFT